MLVNTGLRVRVALHTDRLARTFARAGVGLCALTAHRQAAHVADATMALDALQTLEVHADFAAEITFNDILAVLDRVNDLRKLRFAQILRANLRVDVGLGQNLHRVRGADAINIPQRDINALIRRNFYTNNTCHKLSLPLLVAFVAANNPNDALAPDDFAIFAKFFD